jgi:hypothetical protein
MTAVTEFMQDTATPTNQAIASPAQTLDGGRLMVRGGQSLLGAALILAAVGLWIMPGSEFSGDVMLMKLVLSLTAAFIGIMLTQQAKTPATPEVEIDTVRREIRLVRRNGKQFECVQSCKFADLDRAEVHGAHVTLWAQGNVMLAEVALTDPQVRRSLMGGLADAGKL